MSTAEALGVMVQLMVLIGFSFLAFKWFNGLLFMMVAGVALVLGLYWYDAFTTNIGLTIGLVLIGYGIVCAGLALRCLFWKEDIE